MQKTFTMLLFILLYVLPWILYIAFGYVNIKQNIYENDKCQEYDGGYSWEKRGSKSNTQIIDL